MPLDEEQLAADDIQGNILAGFQKDYQRLLFLRMPTTDDGLRGVRLWLSALARQISSVSEVLRFNRLFREMRKRAGDDPPGLVATWLNIAFSAAALRVLTSAAEVEEFVDQFFKDGLQSRSGALGDPLDPDADGHPGNWVVGGPNNEADIVLLVASDSPALLAERVEQLKNAFPPAIVVLWEQAGETLDAPLTGHEHFGFKDGVSQPGVRGLIPSSPPEYLTPRLIDPHQTPQTDPAQPEFSKPGQPLIWPGQFVFGYLRQSALDARVPPLPPFDLALGCPIWGRNGSFLVVRRLTQDVPAFREFMRAEAARLSQRPGFGGLSTVRFASLCVGRWPSGAPVMRSPATENTQLGEDRYADNFFGYVNDSPTPFPLLPAANYPGDNFPTSRADDRGITCPFSAHVRKINPRDTITEQGSSEDSLTRLVLRRGIPFGPAHSGTLEQDAPEPIDTDQVERGLIFISYQTSIEEQFVFLQANWANHPRNPSDQGGHDPIIGQGNRAGGGLRTFDVLSAGQPKETVTLTKDWVIPTGGGFFFSPAISAIANILGKVL